MPRGHCPFGTIAYPPSPSPGSDLGRPPPLFPISLGMRRGGWALGDCWTFGQLASLSSRSVGSLSCLEIEVIADDSAYQKKEGWNMTPTTDFCPFFCWIASFIFYNLSMGAMRAWDKLQLKYRMKISVGNPSPTCRTRRSKIDNLLWVHKAS